MKTKKIIGVAMACAMLTGITLSTGCISTNNEVDVKQVIATVNIADDAKFAENFGEYASALTTETFLKRDMLTSYFNGYYQYVESMGAERVFEAIKDSLVENAIITQYATVELLKYRVETEKELSLDVFKSKETIEEKYEYLVGEEGVKKAKYQLASTLNSVLDNAEKSFVKDADEDYEGSGTRSTPSGIDTLKEDYVPEQYDVYTGYEGHYLDSPAIAAAVENGDYEPLDNTNKNTRRQAYASFILSLKSNYLVTAEDKDVTNIYEISYVKESYITQLQQVIVDQFNDVYEAEQEVKINTTDADGVYTYVKNRYDGKEGELTKQKNENAETNGFDSTMGSQSDTKFILYSPDTSNDTEEIEIDNKKTYGTYGYVYNILLPFSSTQSAKLDELKSRQSSNEIDDNDYFYDRNQILKNIKTTDQRSAWFNGTTDYSFNANEAGLDYYGKDKGRDYLFFENNLTKTDKYEELDKYIGKYAFNGTVTLNEDGSYKLVRNELGIDGMLEEFSAYIDYVAGAGSVSYTSKGDAYYNEKTFTKEGEDKAIDYEKLVYASGKVSFKDGKVAKDDMFVKGTSRYDVMAAVNELQYAYTTDTGVLSQYIGYSVSAYDTSYIAEFEYAAQMAIREGVGSFKVCAGDYGWHLIYVTDTFTFNENGCYAPVWKEDRIKAEGTFENRFYEWLKDSVLTQEVSLKRAEVLKTYNTDAAVKVYKKAYKDLTGIS